MVWRNVRRTMLIDVAVMWPGVYALTRLTLACSQRKKSAGMPHASIYIDLLSCFVTFCVRAMTISLGCCHRSKCHALLFVHAHCSFAAMSSSARDKRYRDHTKVSKPSLAFVEVCAQAFLSAVLAAGIVDSVWKDMPSRWHSDPEWLGATCKEPNLSHTACG